MDIESLLRSLNAHDVRYVIIGAFAFPVHGYNRTTLDIDLFIANDEANAEATWKALRDTGYDVTDLTPDELRRLKVLLRQYIVATDIHPHVAGADFEGVWARRIDEKFGSVPTHFASLDDLITMKEAAGRPKDIEDLKMLRALKSRRR